uniref:Aquaporin 9b n=1 Tax=Xiphophorus couchianus TaxID=32473 RepID=A0A3B5LVC2_9TELE
MEEESRRKMKEKFGLRRDMSKEFLAEFLGIFVLIKIKFSSTFRTVLYFTESFMTFTVGVSHVNPAVSLAMVILGKLPLKKFPVYVVAQFLGAFAGSCAVFGLYYGELKCRKCGKTKITGENATANIFASYPAKHLSVLNGFVDQVIATGALVLCILAITDRKNIGAPKGMEPLCIGLTIMAIGVSMGLNCGYPINPARDLGPRLFTAVAGWGMEVFRAGGCWWWIPVAGPMVGGAVGAGIYFLFIDLHQPEPQKQDDNNVQDKYEIISRNTV